MVLLVFNPLRVFRNASIDQLLKKSGLLGQTNHIAFKSSEIAEGSGTVKNLYTIQFVALST